MYQEKDSFWTRAYKGGWIHGCYNRVEKREEIKVQFADGRTRPAKSYRSAQLLLNAASK